MKTDTLIQLENISAGYEGKIVLHDINLSVAREDYIGVIGPNGGGKTTLIKVILGLLKPAGGRIQFFEGGEQTDSITMGYLPQYNSIDKKFPISVEEVVRSGLSPGRKILNQFTREQKEKVNHVIARMGLEKLNKRAIWQLSGGELQRALLGRAIIADPQVVILDEPSTYIDKQFEAKLYELLAEINKECAIILVSHDIGTIQQKAKTIAYVNETLEYHNYCKKPDSL